jgi:DNA repair exonuclease SbcCD nuclease subunit
MPIQGTAADIIKIAMVKLFETFNKVIDLCNADNIDLLLIAGDLFHNQPSEKILKEVNYSFSKLNNTKVVLMAGNHDYAPIDSKFSNFVWNDNVHMLSNEKVEEVCFEDINTCVYGFSYDTRNISVNRYDDLQPYDMNKINIVLGHGGEPNYVPIDFKKMTQSKFDYVALGHIHKPNIIDERVAYAGSLEPLDKTETGDHGYIIGEINEDKCDVRLVPFAKRRYFNLIKHVESDITNGELLDILKKDMESYGRHNIFSFVIKGYKEPELLFDIEGLKEEYNIISFKDESLPDYDFKALYEDNIDNIIGMYISKINGMDIEDSMKRKALYLGIDALMKR